jgi:hypothetical protein
MRTAMRGAVSASAFALALGCGGLVAPTEKPTEKPSEQSAEGGETLPAPTTKLRVLAGDLYRQYRGFKPHPHEGKRVVIQTHGSNCYGVRTSTGQHLVLEDSSKLFRRPRMVYVMRSTRGWKNGELSGDLYLEGTVRGAVDFDSKRWAKEWLKLTPNSMEDKFVLIEDAQLVAAPKD